MDHERDISTSIVASCADFIAAQSHPFGMEVFHSWIRIDHTLQFPPTKIQKMHHPIITANTVSGPLGRWAVGPLARLQSVTELLGFQRAAAWAAGEKCRALVVDSWSVRGLYERISPAQPMVVEFCWFFLHPTQQILELYGIIKWVYYFHLHKSSIKSYQIIDKISIIINHSL